MITKWCNENLKNFEIPNFPWAGAQCPSCHARLSINLETTGVKCPACAIQGTIPSLAQASGLPPPPVT